MDTKFERLLDIINNEELTSLNWQVANEILLLGDTVKGISTFELSERCHVSEATISRFCKYVGAGGYQEFKDSFTNSLAPLPLSLFHMEQSSYKLLKDNPEIYLQTYAKEIIQTITNASLSIDVKKISKLAEDIESTKRVYLISHPASLSLIKMVQLNLYALGKLVYVADNQVQQQRYISQLTDKDLVIVISTFGNIATFSPSVMKELHKSKSKSILITQNPGIQSSNLFDEVFLFSDINSLEGGTYSMILGLEFLVRYYSVFLK